jgi:outer membrane protein assembly factor BamB
MDLKGNVIWNKDFGNMDKRASFGEGSSPVLYKDRVFIMWDHEGPSYLFALDKKTGKEIWKVERDEPSSWSSPFIVEHEGRLQVIASATTAVRSYDFETGDPIWKASGLTYNVIPMPVYLDGMVIVMSGFRGNAAMAIRLKGAKGDITDTDSIVWKLERDAPYTPSPLLYENTLYFLKTNSSVMTSIDARTGKEIIGRQRLEGLGTVYSSPVGANGNVYITDRDGNTLVIRHSKEFEVVATNSLDDGFDASAAIVDNEIFLRGQKNLYCISEQN